MAGAIGMQFGLTSSLGAPVKFNPGVYPEGNLQVPRLWDTAGWDEVLSYIADRGVDNEPNNKGVTLIATYGSLRVSEGQDGIDETFEAIDTMLDACEAAGLRLRLAFWIFQYLPLGSSMPSTPQTNDVCAVPDHWIDNGWAGLTNLGSVLGINPDLSNADAMDELIEWYQALGARYNGDDRFEGFESFETANLHPEPWTSEKQTALDVQVRRFMDEVHPFWPNTVHHLFLNYFSWFNQDGVNDTRSLFDYMVETGWSWAAPDMKPVDPAHPGAFPNPADLIWIGHGVFEDWEGIGDIDFGTTVYRGRCAAAVHNEFIYQQDREVILAYSKEVLQQPYLIWGAILAGQGASDFETWTGEDGIYEWLITQEPVVNDACPIGFDNRCAPTTI
jgi:hypothetical protein